jgi:hypothetical protein
MSPSARTPSSSAILHGFDGQLQLRAARSDAMAQLGRQRHGALLGSTAAFGEAFDLERQRGCPFDERGMARAGFRSTTAQLLRRFPRSNSRRCAAVRRSSAARCSSSSLATEARASCSPPIQRVAFPLRGLPAFPGQLFVLLRQPDAVFVSRVAAARRDRRSPFSCLCSSACSAAMAFGRDGDRVFERSGLFSEPGQRLHAPASRRRAQISDLPASISEDAPAVGGDPPVTR